MLIRKIFNGLAGGSLLLFGVYMPVVADTLITVQGVPVGSTVTLGGTVVPYKDVTFSAQIPGRIKSIAGEEGDQFGAAVFQFYPGALRTLGIKAYVNNGRILGVCA